MAVVFTLLSECSSRCRRASRFDHCLSVCFRWTLRLLSRALPLAPRSSLPRRSILCRSCSVSRHRRRGKQRRLGRCPSAYLLLSHPLAVSSRHLLLCPPGSRCREDGQLFHNWVSGTIVIDERAPIEYADE